MRSPLKALALIALVFTLGVAACGSDAPGTGDPADTSTAGVGLSVQEALLVGLDAPQLISGYLIEDGGTLKLCDSLQESEPPGCGEPSLTVEGDMLADVPRGELVDVNGQVTGTTFTPTE
ncbi:MAG: hypothetical protein K0T00_21 [Gaiellaceae bacterium]|jgi:hypothetical protein|nr:hypothetical protein [Gaiellaceae bacterium]